MFFLANRNPIGPWGLLGKIPAQGDFVRLHTGDPAAQELHRWLEEAVQGLHRGKQELPAEPLYFAFAPAGAKVALVGVMRPSRDQVGRAFPLAAFAPVEVATASGRLGALPFAFRPFFDRALALLSDSGAASASGLDARLRALSLPTVADLDRATEATRKELAVTAWSARREALWRSGADTQPYYAFRTFLLACERAREPERSGALTLECPVATDTEVAFWLELARRLLPWRAAVPCVFWTRGPSARLLLALGTPAPAAFGYLASPTQPPPKLWPLQTERADAIDSARQTLTAIQRTALEQPASTLASLLDALSARS